MTHADKVNYLDDLNKLTAQAAAVGDLIGNANKDNLRVTTLENVSWLLCDLIERLAEIAKELSK